MSEILIRAYAAFNARDIDAVLATMHPDVDWPNAWEGGRILGHAGVRDYWTRQWAEIDPTVEPVEFSIDDQGRTIVKVHQIVRDRRGNILLDSIVEHVYTTAQGLIRKMDVQP